MREFSLGALGVAQCSIQQVGELSVEEEGIKSLTLVLGKHIPLTDVL